MSEKLRTQQMNNDLEKLTHELEKIGLNKERLLHDEGSDDRYPFTKLHKHFKLLKFIAHSFKSSFNSTASSAKSSFLHH